MRSKGQQKCWKKGHFVRFLRYSFLVLSVTVVIALSCDKKVTSDGIFGGKKGSVSGWGLDLRKCLLYAQIPGKNFPTITWFYGLRVVLSTEKMSFHENHVFPSFPYLSNFPRQSKRISSNDALSLRPLHSTTLKWVSQDHFLFYNFTKLLEKQSNRFHACKRYATLTQNSGQPVNKVNNWPIFDEWNNWSEMDGLPY